MNPIKRLMLFVLLMLAAPVLLAAQPDAASDSFTTTGSQPLLQLGPGDQLKMEVFGRPEMDSTMYVADDGTIRVPLAGPVAIGGLAPGEAAKKVELALKNGQYLNDPHVTLTVAQSLSQRVSVVGEVRTPGRYTIDSTTTILDVLAQAGGETERGADVIYVLRQDASGNLNRLAVNTKGATDDAQSTPSVLLTVRSGDRIVVPVYEQFFVSGAVTTPGGFRLESGMTVIQAIARAGGVNDRGSNRRVEVKRKDSKGNYTVFSAKPNDMVEPNDVLTVKERIF